MVNGGTLDLGGSTATGSIGSGALTLAGGTLTYTRTRSTTQTFTGTTINSGGSTLTAAAGNTLVLGAITRNTTAANGTIDGTLCINPTGTVTTTTANRNGNTSSANTNGFLGAYAVYGSYDWASNNGGTITYFGGYTTYNNVASFATGADLTDNNGYDGSYTNALTVNSVRFNEATRIAPSTSTAVPATT